MKVEYTVSKKLFRPFTILIETEEEASVIRAGLNCPANEVVKYAVPPAFSVELHWKMWEILKKVYDPL